MATEFEISIDFRSIKQNTLNKNRCSLPVTHFDDCGVHGCVCVSVYVCMQCVCDGIEYGVVRFAALSEFSPLAPLMVRSALEDVRLAMRAERVADVRIERMRVGREGIVGVGGVGMRRVERIVRRRSGTRTRMDTGSTKSAG